MTVYCLYKDAKSHPEETFLGVFSCTRYAEKAIVKVAKNLEKEEKGSSTWYNFRVDEIEVDSEEFL